MPPATLEDLDPIALPTDLVTRQLGLDEHGVGEIVAHRNTFDAGEWLLLFDGAGNASVVKGGFQVQRVDDRLVHPDEADRVSPRVRVVVFELDRAAELLPERAVGGGYYGFQALLIGVYPLSAVKLCARGAIDVRGRP